MSNLRNRVSLIGHVGQDPEVKVLENGSKLVKFSLATNDWYYDKDGRKIEETAWHRLIAFGKTAEFIEQYVQKGSKLAVDGQITYRQFENNEGQTVYLTEIRVSEVMLLDPKD